MKHHHKLVRDRIPEIILSTGKRPVCETLEEDVYIAALEKKLLEEANEYLNDPSYEEMADLMEVLEAIVKARRFDQEKLLNIKNAKAAARGGFEKRIFLHSVLEPGDPEF